MGTEQPDEVICTHCKSPIPPASPFGICPRCCFGAVDRGTAHQEGDKISGIELGELIGEGAFGMVYEGVQLDYSLRRVAVKVMRGSGFDAGHRARFLEEMQILAHLKHPHIAQLVGSGQMKDERPYYAMEFIEGAKLDDYSREHQRENAQVLELMIQLTEAVSHAHKHGIVHRDLKPSNVLIENETGHAKVIDFGIARILSGPLLVSHEVTLNYRLGSPRYMSPEQLEGDPQIDTRTDIYSLGLLLYELCLGESVLAPVISADQSWVENSQRLKQFRFPRLTARGYPRELDWIAQKACAYERNERYQTAESLLKDLNALKEGTLVTAGQHDWLYRTRKLAKRYRVGLTIVTLLLLLFAAVAGMGVWMSVKERSAKEEISRSMELAREAEHNAQQDASDARLQEANLALNAGDPAEALALLTKALELWPENDEARYAHDFLVSTRAFPLKKETIPIDFEIVDITPTPQGFLLKGSQGEQKTITQLAKTIAHPLDDLDIEDFGDGIIHFKSRATGEALMSPLAYGSGREKAQFSSNTASVLSTTAQGEVQLWDVSGLRRTAEAHTFEKKPLVAFFETHTSHLWIVDEDLYFCRWKQGGKPEGRIRIPGQIERFLANIKHLSKREGVWLVNQGGESPDMSGRKSLVAFVQLAIAEKFGDWYIDHLQVARDQDVRILINDSGEIWMENALGIYTKHLTASALVKQLGISAEGSLAAILCENNEIATFLPKHKEFIHRWTPSFKCRRISLLDGGERLIAIGEDGKARSYDPRTGQQIGPVIALSGTLSLAQGIEIAPVPHRQEFLIRMDGDRQIKRWDALTGKQIGRGLLHHDGVYWFRCSLDGKFLFSIDQADHDPQRSFLRIWSLRTGKEIVPALAHDSPMNSATIMDRGQRIATTTSDGKVRRWTISQ